ncbi:MAG: hypothetical protein SH850_10055 [Planctomycetaceae bacterium]|nr:hypothetical protein [Planctomycetaceae bacterium]
MDAFEQVIASLLEREGFWVRSCVKVELTKLEKRKIGRHSSPRWELDLVAYHGGTNELRIVECKSYLDSGGVSMAAFDGTNATFANRIKLFNDDILRRVVFTRLRRQLVNSLACAPKPKMTLMLAAGRIASDSHRENLKKRFDDEGWILWDEEKIRTKLRALAEESYENAVASVAAKILVRERSSRRKSAEQE